VKADYGVMFAAPWCPNGENLRYTLQGGKDACVICCPSSDLDACQYQRIDSHDDRCDPEQHGVFMRWLQCPTGLSAGH
jgi:hypothetical protein